MYQIWSRYLWSDTGSIRHGAVVCRIVNWKRLNAYSVTSPLNIWTKFSVWLPGTLGWSTLKGLNFVVSIIYFIDWTAKGGGGGLLQILISEAEEEEGVLNSKLEWI